MHVYINIPYGEDYDDNKIPREDYRDSACDEEFIEVETLLYMHAFILYFIEKFLFTENNSFRYDFFELGYKFIGFKCLIFIHSLVSLFSHNN